jgi:hypothetical protein
MFPGQNCQKIAEAALRTDSGMISGFELSIHTTNFFFVYKIASNIFN